MTRKLALLVSQIALLVGINGGAFAEVTGGKVERGAPDKVVVSWSDKAPVDIYLADSADAGISTAKLVSHNNKTGRFEVAVAATGRPYFLLKDTKDGAVAEVAERALPLEQGSNFRDLGGYPAAGGKHVRWGKVFRSGGTPMLSEADLARIKLLKLTDLVDLRSSEERSVAPTRIEDVRYTAVGYSMERMMSQGPVDPKRLNNVYRTFPTFLAPQMRVLFQKLLEDGTTVAYNCSAGQDRTGFATALLLTALGVPRDVILADYHLSTTYRRPQYEAPKIDPALAQSPGVKYFASLISSPAAATPQPLFDAEHKPFLAMAFAEIEEKWGSVEAYLDKEVGVDAAGIARLRTKYLE
jgi:protein-tyrosine phosphatase